MRIAIDGRLILPSPTGIGRYLFELSSALAGLPGDEQIELWVQSSLPKTHPAWQIAASRSQHTVQVEVRCIPYNHMSCAGHLGLPIQVKKGRLDLFHYPHFDLPRFTPGKIVATLHDLKYLARPDFFPQRGFVRQYIIRRMTAFTLERARIVMCDSSHTAMDAVRLLKANRNKLRVVPLGVSTRYFDLPPAGRLEQIRKQYGLTTPFILYVGDRRPHKNLPGLIRAFERLTKIAPDPFNLVIIGQRYRGYNEPEHLIERLGLEDRIRLIDSVPDSELPGFYRLASVCALLSFYEGFGMTVLESMACGTPVVASNRTSLPEAGGAAACLVAPDDPAAASIALRDAIYDDSLRADRIGRGLDHARNYTWERCAQAVLEVYREAADGHND